MLKYIKEKLILIKKSVVFYITYYDDKEELSILKKANFFKKEDLE